MVLVLVVSFLWLSTAAAAWLANMAAAPRSTSFDGWEDVFLDVVGREVSVLEAIVVAAVVEESRCLPAAWEEVVVFDTPSPYGLSSTPS